jgi:acyl carrier protein
VSEQQLKDSFIAVLGIEPNIDWTALTYRSIPEWDSLAHMQLVAQIEESFDIMIDTQDVIDMSSFDIAKDILAKYGVSFDE